MDLTTKRPQPRFHPRWKFRRGCGNKKKIYTKGWNCGRNIMLDTPLPYPSTLARKANNNTRVFVTGNHIQKTRDIFRTIRASFSWAVWWDVFLFLFLPPTFRSITPLLSVFLSQTFNVSGLGGKKKKLNKNSQNSLQYCHIGIKL